MSRLKIFERKDFARVGRLGASGGGPSVSCLVYPKGLCAQTVDTLALKWCLFGYFGAKVSTTWVHGRSKHPTKTLVQPG